MTFALMYKQIDFQNMLMVTVVLRLILRLTIVSGTQQKSDICQVIKKFYLQILRHQKKKDREKKNTALKEIFSQTD